MLRPWAGDVGGQRSNYRPALLRCARAMNGKKRFAARSGSRMAKKGFRYISKILVCECGSKWSDLTVDAEIKIMNGKELHKETEE